MPIELHSSLNLLLESGHRVFKGQIKDKDGGTTEYTATVQVNNVAPTVTLGPVLPIFSFDTAVVEIDFSDPGVNDAPWDYTIDWNDGPSDDGITSDQSKA